MSEIEIIGFKPKDIKIYDFLIKLLADVYIGTGGKYPAMEWLKPEEKPKIDSKTFYEDFEKAYGSFLKWRLTNELDEVYLAKLEGTTVGVVALNYNLEGKNISWIPKDYMNRRDVGFIELFVVHPNYQGRGVGKILFEYAIKRLRDLRKKPCVVTFPNLDAIKFYEKFGGKLIKKYDPFVLYCFD